MTQPIRSCFRRFAAWLRRAWRAILPGRRAWVGAALGVTIAALLFILPATWAHFRGTDLFGLVIGFAGYLIAGAVVAGLIVLLRRLLTLPSDLYIAAVAFGLSVLYIPLASEWQRSQPVMLAILAIVSLLGAAAWVLVAASHALAERHDRPPAFDPMAITEVRLISDRTPAGTVVLDDLGFRQVRLCASTCWGYTGRVRSSYLAWRRRAAARCSVDLLGQTRSERWKPTADSSNLTAGRNGERARQTSERA